MTMETREHNIMSIGGLKVDKTVTISGLIQILLLVLGFGSLLLKNYTDEIYQNQMIKDNSALISQLQTQMMNNVSMLEDKIAVVNQRVTASESSGAVLIEKNENRWAAVQSTLSAHESRLNVQNEAEQGIRSRLGEMFDELRAINSYIRQLGYVGIDRKDNLKDK